MSQTSPRPADRTDSPRAAAVSALLLGAAATALGFAPPATSPTGGKVAAPQNATATKGAARTPPGAAGGDAKDKEKPQVKVSEQMTVDLHVRDEDLGAVLNLLSAQTQKNIIASKSVSARITADLYGVTFYEALDSILHVNGYGYVEQGNFIYVYTLDELDQIQKSLSRRVAKVIRLNYLNAADAAEFAKPLTSEGGEVKTSTKAENFQIPDKAPVGKDDYALGATLVVIDYEENIKAVEKLLAELDTKPAQVLVEATILQTALNEANAFGVDFSLIGDLQFLDFLNAGGPLKAADGLIRGGSGAANQGLSPKDNRGTAAQSTPGNTGGPGTFKLGVVQNDVAVFLKALDEVTDTTILSNPKILALNRQPARVLVGRRVGFLNTTATETSTTQTVEFLDTGTQLYFRPFVSNTGEIRMELKPQVSEAIIREAKDATGAAVSIPDEITQEIVTNVNVKDGSTIVLGGLFRESTQAGRRQVPIVGDIPIVGAAFRGHDDTTQRSEIIFLITPTIISDNTMADQGREGKNSVEHMRAGARQGLLPWSREKMTASLNVEAERLARAGDVDKANWTLGRSLSLNPVQPDAYRLRERITGQREVWPDRSVMSQIMDPVVGQRQRNFPVPAIPTEKIVPWGATDLHREPVSHGGGGSSSMAPAGTIPVQVSPASDSSAALGSSPPVADTPASDSPISLAPVSASNEQPSDFASVRPASAEMQPAETRTRAPNGNAGAVTAVAHPEPATPLASPISSDQSTRPPTSRFDPSELVAPQLNVVCTTEPAEFAALAGSNPGEPSAEPVEAGAAGATRASAVGNERIVGSSLPTSLLLTPTHGTAVGGGSYAWIFAQARSMFLARARSQEPVVANGAETAAPAPVVTVPEGFESENK
ncbi:MAG: hypothetical protein JNM07_06280 [Phycisphaerae bacterium]|nr:hypothetical protein [Phycisphaerae bacterium]